LVGWLVGWLVSYHGSGMCVQKLFGWVTRQVEGRG